MLCIRSFSDNLSMFCDESVSSARLVQPCFVLQGVEGGFLKIAQKRAGGICVKNGILEDTHSDDPLALFS